ncbi:MAG: SEC-C domain-containing protein [Betaproteobacteria bacterium]
MSNSVIARSRNAPCACGSGRRYKNCCGATVRGTAAAAAAAPIPAYIGWDAFSPQERADLWRMMLEALAAQRALRNDAAGRLYEEVVARAPLTFDAVHMLGVVRMMEGDLDAADSLLTRAAELAPDEPSIRHNLRMLGQRRQEHEGLYSVRAIVAGDILRLYGAARGAASPADSDPFAAAIPGTPLHVVIPGDAMNAGSNQTGGALARLLGEAAQLWSGPSGDARLAAAAGACPLEANKQQPAGGSLVLFGLNARLLSWLPAAAALFDSIVVAFDAHDPATCVELLGQLPAPVATRVRFVARRAALLEDLGLPGTVHPMVFGDPVPQRRHGSRHTRPHIGVFIPALRDREDIERWNVLEWLRRQDAFLRVLYPGRLPSPHIPNADEHLLGLATSWADWTADLDALFYWGAEGHMRQYDRLVFEAIGADLMVVADGFGDFGATLAARGDCAQFFTPDAARSGMEALLRHWQTTASAEAVS